MILQASARMVRGEAQQAEKMLRDARKQHPKEIKLWIALANLAEKQGQPKEASALLDEAERTLGDGIDLRLARASQLVRRDGAKSVAALTKLAEGTEKFTASDRERLLRGLAMAHRLADDGAGAIRLWSQLAELRPNDLGIRIALFDLALSSKEKELTAIRSAVDDIRRIEGTEGSLWKYCAGISADRGVPRQRAEQTRRSARTA